MAKGRKKKTAGDRIPFDRVQTGLRMDRRMLKVLKALAEYHDVSLGEMLEVIVLYSFVGTSGFSKGTLRRIEELRKIYDMNYGTEVAHWILFADPEKQAGKFTQSRNQ